MSVTIFQTEFSAYTLTRISSCSASAPVTVCQTGSGREWIVAEEGVGFSSCKYKLVWEMHPHVLGGVHKVMVWLILALSCSCHQPRALSLCPALLLLSPVCSMAVAHTANLNTEKGKGSVCSEVQFAWQRMQLWRNHDFLDLRLLWPLGSKTCIDRVQNEC